MSDITLTVDVEDVLDQIRDRHLIREVERRGLETKNEPDARAVVAEAINLIRTGRVTDGVTLLEREFLPKWKDRADCQAAYQTAMALGGGA